MGEFERTPRSLEQVLSERGLTIDPIAAVPDHITIRPLAKELQVKAKIDVLGIATVVFFENPEEAGKFMAVWCFNGEETTRKYGNRIDVEAEVAESIELNLRSEKEKNEAVVELYSLVNRYGGSIKEIREFPADLDGTGSFYMKPSDFGPEGRTVLRMDFPHGITILSLPVSGRELYVGLFKNGKYQGGNGDFSVHEIESNIRILNEG